MQGNIAPGVFPRAGGVPVSGVYYYRAGSVIAGGEAGLRAGPGGVAIGRFGWVSPAGVVLNARTSAQDIVGLVVIETGDWRKVFWDELTQTWRIRAGLGLTMLSHAPGMWVVLPGGGSWRERVYANPVDGTPVAGYADGLESTRWSVGKPNGPGGLSLLTTWNKPL